MTAPAGGPASSGSPDAPAGGSDAYLAASSRLLTEVIAGARGTWPRACAWLIRLALEAELTCFWESVSPPVALCRSRRAQLLLLPRYAGPATGLRAAQAWAALSRAGHHHAYELGLTASELGNLQSEVQHIVALLRTAAVKNGQP